MNTAISAQTSKLVIIADDTTSGRMVVAQVLRVNGYSVQEADSALAVTKFLAMSPDASVVLNLTMPPYRGAEYVQAIRAQMAPGAKLVAYTASDPSDLEQLVISAGADGLLPTPVPYEELLRALVD